MRDVPLLQDEGHRLTAGQHEPEGEGPASHRGPRGAEPLGPAEVEGRPPLAEPTEQVLQAIQDPRTAGSGRHLDRAALERLDARAPSELAHQRPDQAQAAQGRVPVIAAEALHRHIIPLVIDQAEGPRLLQRGRLVPLRKGLGRPGLVNDEELRGIEGPYRRGDRTAQLQGARLRGLRVPAAVVQVLGGGVELLGDQPWPKREPGASPILQEPEEEIPLHGGGHGPHGDRQAQVQPVAVPRYAPQDHLRRVPEAAARKGGLDRAALADEAPAPRKEQLTGQGQGLEPQDGAGGVPPPVEGGDIPVPRRQPDGIRLEGDGAPLGGQAPGHQRTSSEAGSTDRVASPSSTRKRMVLSSSARSSERTVGSKS